MRNQRCWHQVAALDMWYPKDVKKMLLHQARTVYWKKWAAKHEYEELKEGISLEAALALLRKKTKEDWIGQMKVSAKLVTRRKAQKSTGSTIAQNGTKPDGRSQRLSESGSKKREPQKGSGSGKEVFSRIFSVESQWNRGHFSVRKWESEKHNSWGFPAEGFKGHVATGGSLLGAAGKWRACAWSVVPLDFDEGLGPLHGMCGSMGADFVVQRTIKRAELTAFLCFLKKVIGLIKEHVDHKGSMNGLWRGERKCSDPKAGDADLWMKIWEESHLPVSKEISVEGGARQGAPHKGGQNKRCRILRSLSLKAKEQCWTKIFWRK